MDRMLCHSINDLKIKEGLQYQFIVMTPEQIAQRMKSQLQQGSALTQATIGELKKYFDQVKNAQNVTNARPQEMLQFKEKVIGFLLSSLNKGQHGAKEKILVLQVLERDLISCKHNANLFNKLYYYLLEEDENVAIQASKAIDQLIKQINENTQVTATAAPLDTKQHYLKLFEFLKDKTEFFVRLSEHAKDPDYKAYRRQNYDERDREKDKKEEKKEIVLKNSKSLKFINQVPHLFIHLMAYVDTSNRNQEDDNKIKQLIRKSIDNIIQSLRKTPYEQFYNQFNFEFNNELFGVMTKLLQFLFINLRSEKDQNANNNKSNINLKKHIADQIEHIKVPQVIKNFIYLLKNCSEDFQLNRYQVVNRLKLLLNNLDKTKLGKADAVQIMNQILNEETIFGRKKVLGDYSKNAICSYWIEMIKSNVLLYNIFPPSILSVKTVPQGAQDETPEIGQCFTNIERLMEEVLKTMFDNTFYPSVQEKCIELVTFLIDQLFPEGVDTTDNSNLFATNILARKIQQHKLRILLRILDCTSLKLMNIRHIFQQIDEYVTRKIGHRVTKKELPQPLKLEHMQLSSLTASIAESESWEQEAVDFIEAQSGEIDNSLLTVSVAQNKFITIYEEQDELCFNSHPVKLNNYTLYMKEVKTKLLEKCITLAHKITKTFLSQNIEVYNQVEVSSLKAIYFVLSNKKALTQDQCRVLSTILRNGLKIFEILHNYDLHSDDQTNKKGHLKNFMLIFAQIYDPVNFRDIFQPNMSQFFKNLINYAKNCAEYCLQFVLIEPYCSNQQSQPFNKNIVELLTYNLIIRLENTSDQLDPFHEFYHYKQEYFLLLQKLIRFPFRCLSRYSDQSFIRNYFRQIILFLTKKAHTSRFCLDYLHLMRTLFKNILFNSNRQAASPLFSEFYAICYRNAQSMSSQGAAHSVFINVNVLDNFLKFYETGIPELADIVTELVIMLPLKSKHIIQFAKQGYIVKPLLHCLCLMSDYNYLLRTLKTFQIIISHSSADQISQFLSGVKDKLINRLFQMIVAQHKPNDLKPDKINNDLSSLSLKLLAKLGALSRNRDISIEWKGKRVVAQRLDFHLLFKGRNEQQVTLSLSDSIDYAIQIFHKLLDSFYQSIIFISMEMIEKSFAVLVDVLPLALAKMHPLAQKILFVFSAILALSSKYLTISPSILSKIREEVKNQIKEHTDAVKLQLRDTGLTQYCKFYMGALVQNLSERVLITREENFIKEISQQPKKFIWGLLSGVIDEIKDCQSYEETVEFIMRLLISAVVSLKNPHQIRLNPYQNDYNHILPYKNAALGVMSELLEKMPLKLMDEMYPDILETVFVAVASIPDILCLKILKHPRNIAHRVFRHMLRDQALFLERFKTDRGRRVFACILDNLIGYSLEAHQIAMQFVELIMKETSIGFHELLYGGGSWEEVADLSREGQARSQAKYSLNDFTMWREMKLEMQPIVPLVKNLLRIAHNINEESLKSNPSLLKMLHNCFATLQLLISLKHDDKIYQAFQMLQIPEDGDEPISFNETFKKIITVAQQVININDKIYDNFTKIIIQQPQTNTQPPTAQQRQQNPPPNSRTGNTGPQPPGQPPPAPSNNQSFSINTNTFIDDEEYGLNIEDLDIQVKNWGRLIGAILRFLKTILLNQNIYTASKTMLRRKSDKSKLVETRLQIIFVMFDLIGRVDKTVRQTAYQCLRELLSREEHPKDLIQNDDKLKHILRPVLISLQLQFKKFTPSFLHMFRKILKLLTQCFNITLIQKLVDKLREMEKTKEGETSSQSKALPTQQNPKQLNYSQITLETKCIANFLALFQHLAYAYHNHRSSNYTVNSIILIFKYVGNICNFFTPKLGRHTIKMQIKTTLARVLNTMCQKLSGESIFVEGQERELDLDNFLEIISLEDSFPLREKLTRETSYIDKALTELAKNKSKKEYVIFLEIVCVLAKKNSRWMKGFTSFGEKVTKELNETVQLRYGASTGERREFQLNERNQIILLSKILLEFVKQNIQDLKAMFSLVGVFKLRGTLDLHFIRMFFKYELYELASADTKRQMVLQFLSMLRGVQSGDCQKIIAISQQIVYPLVLREVNMAEEERQVLREDEELMRSLSETIKMCLNPRILHNKGFSSSGFKQSANNYRIAIEMLQISNLALSAIKNILNETNRNSMILTIWGLLRIEDKIIKNYAFVWASNYIRTFDGFDSNKALGLYLTLIKSLESLSQGDYEIGTLIKKALNILIPYWDSRQRAQTNWIDWSLKAVHEENNQPSKLVRFWQIVVKNHHIFHKFKQSKFETQMVNSMQWLMVANNPSSGNPLVKKIASDMSFIYIEWKFKEARAKLLDTPPSQKVAVLQDSLNDRAAEICLNFFIKVALNNSSDKDDKQIMKRSLFLLKKTLILWPHTKKKFDAIRTIVTKLKNSSSNVTLQNTQMPLRFHFTLLNIIHILLLYEKDERVLPILTQIFKLLELGGHIAPTRFTASSPHPVPPGNTIFTMNNIYLLNLLCLIIRRLASVALRFQREEESTRLVSELHNYIRDGFQFHIWQSHKKPQGGSQPVRTGQAMKKIDIEVAICFLKILYDIQPRTIDTHLNYIKQVTSSLKKMFQKGFETSSKNNAQNRVYELPPLSEGNFEEMLGKDMEIRVQLIRPEALVAAEENYEKDNIKSYGTRRPLFVILLRILASKFNSFGHVDDQSNILDILLSIYEKLPDPQLKIEVINILKCMLVGTRAFKGQVIPERYQQIGVISYSVRKIFHLLFEDSSKFNEHFQKRKSKPSDQNYNINQRIYQQITTKVYFNFLCHFVINMPSQELTNPILQKIKIFMLFAVKVADAEVLEEVLNILDQHYAKSSLDLYVNLFQDYKELNCNEQNLQGDQISMFFTYYIYRQATKLYPASVTVLGQQRGTRLHDYFLYFLRADVSSNYYLSGIASALSTAIRLLPSSEHLPKVMKDYLLSGSYCECWGNILLNIALDRNFLSPQELYVIVQRINQWGLLLREMEKTSPHKAVVLLDYAYRAYGDMDLIYGYRLKSTRSPNMRLALLNLQQRKYVESLSNLEDERNVVVSSRRRQQLDDEKTFQMVGLNQIVDESLMVDISRECYRNLNEWDEMVESGKNDLLCNTQFLFHAEGSKEKILNILGGLDRIGVKQFPYYYGRSVINFLESNSSQNKQLNLALLYALVQWLVFPKYSRHNQNKMLVKIECLLELEEGEKIKEESLGTSPEQPSLVQALTKVVQSVYTQINSWRERMPDKHQDLATWHSILGQRITIYEFMKSKMMRLLDSVVNSQSNYGPGINTGAGTQKLLVPYTDIEWNRLRLLKQQRYFGVFPSSFSIQNIQNLYMDQTLLAHKQKFYCHFLHQKDHKKAVQSLDGFIKDHQQQGQKDQELFKIQKLEITRLKAKVLVADGRLQQADALYVETVKGVEQHLLPLWRDWLILSLRGYKETGKVEWAQSVLTILPYALRYKTSKTKLMLAPVMQLLYSLQRREQVGQTLSSVMEFIPFKLFLLWLPQVLRLAEMQKRHQLKEHMYKILQKIAIFYPQTMYFTLKQFYKVDQIRAVKEVFLNIKKIYYNLITKLQNFAQLLIQITNKHLFIPVHLLGALSRTLPEIQVPLYDISRSQLDPQQLPTLTQLAEHIQLQKINGGTQKVITALANDGKEYRFRLQAVRRGTENYSDQFQGVLMGQVMEVANQQLTFWKETLSRKLRLIGEPKVYLYNCQDEVRMARSSAHSLTPEDMLSEYLQNKTSYQSNYPFCDKKLMALPSKTVNRRMKEIVPTYLLRSYLEKNTSTYDDYLLLRRTMAYQYGALSCLQFVLSVPLQLENLFLNLRTGEFSIWNLPFKEKPEELEPFAVRMSTGIQELFGDNYINGGCLPAFLATADALSNPKLNFKAYLELLYQDLDRIKSGKYKGDNLFGRLETIRDNYDKGVRVWQVAVKLGNSDEVPPALKYWL